MKKLVILVLVITSLQSCKNTHNDYITFSGKIENMTDSILTVSGRKGYVKNITVHSDGSFKDTLIISESQFYTLRINSKRKGFLFLKNGYDLHLTTDNDSFIENSKFSGYGAASSNYLISQYNFGKTIGNPMSLFALDKVAFKKKLEVIRHGFDSVKSLFKDIDTTLLRINNKQNQGLFNFLENNYEVQHVESVKLKTDKNKLSKGSISPKFKNYINYKGGTSSLDSFKGKYVYIDVWATWCKPCLGEIPALKSLEKQYHGKNIQFISISIDDKRTAGSWEQAKAKWKKMVASKSLTGVQLYAGQNLKFIQEYQISSIPRFILIDPNGTIVNANAPRPSDSSLINLFNELGI